ncbi:MAG: acyl-CoA dehydrogenase family protein [Deltaproteobacteria bacterium]|jgi:alkylation response protein AidB-like acyl-CoA dehydrogenase|nr:acyl-CoA dehydrogenase family protein [Deltaproteobacteria bacterium]
MNFELSSEQAQARQTARRFAREKLSAAGVETDRTGRFPRQAVQELGKLGMLGVFVPERYGGAGLDHVSYALVVEELAVECAATAVIVSAHSSLASWPILSAGSEAQRAAFLPAMAAGEKLGCFALSEPQAGSDAGAQKTRAVRDGDSYVINGTKNFITNAPEAGVAVVFALTDPHQGQRGISAFIVETERPGWQIVRIEEKMGIHGAHSAQLSFQDLRVPRDRLLGEEGQGFKLALRTLDGGRIGIAAQAVGIGRAALEQSLKYAVQRTAFGKPIASYQAIRWKLADMAVELDAARLLTLKAAALKDAGRPCIREAASAKLFAAEAAMSAAIEAVQVHGGNGYTREFKVERYFRDAKITEIYEGTSEIQRLVIARRLLAEH